MRDVGLTASQVLGPADAAVQYLLDRIQHDVNLRHYMLHTEAFHLLCVAESARTGEPIEAVASRRMVNLVPVHQQRLPDVVELRNKIEELEN